MDRVRLKRWCLANIVWPGVALIDGNGTYKPPPATCHGAAEPASGVAFIQLMEEHLLVVLAITLVTVISVGIVLAVNHMRWRRLLRQQLDTGLIEDEQYGRLR